VLVIGWIVSFSNLKRRFRHREHFRLQRSMACKPLSCKDLRLKKNWRYRQM
jgi:hypothetical protein